jgi:hypothetical protein
MITLRSVSILAIPVAFGLLALAEIVDRWVQMMSSSEPRSIGVAGSPGSPGECPQWPAHPEKPAGDDYAERTAHR